MGKAPESGKTLMRTIYIIRHGQTVLNKEDKIRSWLNIPLNDEGFAEARKLGWEFHSQGIHLDGLFSSDLLRSEQTTVEVSKMTGFPILGTTIALRPWNVGTHAGKDGPMMHKMMMDHAKNKPDVELGGGESFNIFRYRILTGMIGILNANPGKILGLVSHSRGERIFHAWAASQYCEDLGVDLKVFGERGEATASASKLEIACTLVIGGEEGPPVPGARKAPDAHWYVDDTSRPGKYMRVRKRHALLAG